MAVRHNRVRFRGACTFCNFAVLYRTGNLSTYIFGWTRGPHSRTLPLLYLCWLLFFLLFAALFFLSFLFCLVPSLAELSAYFAIYNSIFVPFAPYFFFLLFILTIFLIYLCLFTGGFAPPFFHPAMVSSTPQDTHSIYFNRREPLLVVSFAFPQSGLFEGSLLKAGWHLFDRL